MRRWEEDGTDIAHPTPGGSSLAGRESDDDGYEVVETLCTDIEPAMRNIDKTYTPPPARHRYTKTAARTHATPSRYTWIKPSPPPSYIKH